VYMRDIYYSSGSRRIVGFQIALDKKLFVRILSFAHKE